MSTRPATATTCTHLSKSRLVKADVRPAVILREIEPGLAGSLAVQTERHVVVRAREGEGERASGE